MVLDNGFTRIYTYYSSTKIHIIIKFASSNSIFQPATSSFAIRISSSSPVVKEPELLKIDSIALLSLAFVTHIPCSRPLHTFLDFWVCTNTYLR